MQDGKECIYSWHAFMAESGLFLSSGYAGLVEGFFVVHAHDTNYIALHMCCNAKGRKARTQKSADAGVIEDSRMFVRKGEI